MVIYRAKGPLKAIKMRLDAGHRAMHRQLATPSIHRANRTPHAIKDLPSKPVLEGHFGSSLSLRLCLLCAVPRKQFPSGAGPCGLSELTGRCLRPGNLIADRETPRLAPRSRVSQRSYRAHRGGELDIFNDARAGWGDTPCALDGSNLLGRGAEVETAGSYSG